MVCIYCGADDLKFKAYRGTNKDKQYQCRSCNKYFRIKTERLTIEVKDQIVTWRDLTRVAKEHKSLREKYEFGQTEAQAYIKEDLAIILPLADFHWGNKGTDYLFIESITDYIKANNIYVALIGDLIDSFFTNFKNAAAIFEQVMNPEEQLLFLESWLGEIDEHLVCCTWDNHSTMRAESILGQDYFGKLQSRFAPFFNGIGKLRLKVKNVEYDIVATHKGKGKSMYNSLHSLQNIDRFLTACDLIIGGHYHNPAYGMIEIRGKSVYAIQSGTAEVKDLFSERSFRFGQAQCSFPCAVLNGKEKKILLFERVEDAVRYRG